MNKVQKFVFNFNYKLDRFKNYKNKILSRKNVEFFHLAVKIPDEQLG
jgi:hypothetical protein